MPSPDNAYVPSTRIGLCISLLLALILMGLAGAWLAKYAPYADAKHAVARGTVTLADSLLPKAILDPVLADIAAAKTTTDCAALPQKLLAGHNQHGGIATEYTRVAPVAMATCRAAVALQEADEKRWRLPFSTP